MIHLMNCAYDSRSYGQLFSPEPERFCIGDTICTDVAGSEASGFADVGFTCVERTAHVQVSCGSC